MVMIELFWRLSKQQGFKKGHILRKDHNSESKPTTKICIAQNETKLGKISDMS